MKLSDHVDSIRERIYKAFNNQFARLGIGANKLMEIDKIPTDLHSKRKKIEILIASHEGETGNYEEAREKALDELTFTLFNRLAAIKVMEAHQLFNPIVTKQAAHGGRSFGHKIWLENNPEKRNEELEGMRDYFKYEFNKLGDDLPLFHKNYPYALLPYVIELNDIVEAFNAVETDIDIIKSQQPTTNNQQPNIWQSDDILGWLYESYNNAKKQAHKDSGDKTEYDKVSLQSQVYTPRWVVEFLVHNSLGKMYLEMYPDSEIKDEYKIANAPKTRVREPKPLHEIKLIDPASGSGNFLLYAFAFFYALYQDQIDNYGANYDEEDIPKLIIENNLYGVDLDDRAAQLAQLGLWIKAKQKNRNTTTLNFHVVSSDFFLPDFKEVLPIFESGIADQNQRKIVEEIWTDLQQAHKFGSLVKIEEKLSIKLHGALEKQNENQIRMFDADTIQEYERFTADFFRNLETAVAQYATQAGNSFLTDKTKDAITFLKLITQKYDVATANPPYTDSADFGPELKKYIESNYKKPFAFHTNLYATFIKRCFELTNEIGKIAMIHPRTFMFIKTFEDVRKFILEKTHLNVFVDYSLSNLFGSIMVDPAFYVMEKNIKTSDNAWFISLDQYTRTPNEKFKKEFTLEALNDYIEGKDNIHNHKLPQSKLKIIKSYPFIYWISDEFREKFGEGDIKSVLSPAQGAATTNNLKFLRFWWELDKDELSKDYPVDKKKWVNYAKGGPYEKWFGNMWLYLNYANDADSLKKAGAVLRNSDLYFNKGVTYSASGSKGASFRILPENSVFDTGGSCIFANRDFKNTSFVLGFMNSKLVSYIVDCLNPTVNAQVGDMQRVPFVLPKSKLEEEVKILVDQCVAIKDFTASFKIYESNFNKTNLIESKSISDFYNLENYLITQVLINEAIINTKIFEVYELTDADKAMVLAKEGESIGGLPVTAAAKKDYLENEVAEFPLENIKDFIQNLPETAFSTEEKDKIVAEFPNLYQSNNDLEEFCIRHQVNPINVWYWFKESNIIPKQRMNTLAMEFLADMIREILLEDEDGIIPLVPNAGEKILLDRIEEKFLEKGFSMAQYSAFDGVLGRNIKEYLNGHFFKALSDHLNLFMYLPKTPFIWHLTSGPEQGFDCYSIIYKWDRDKLMRVRSVYIEHRERALVNRQTDLRNKEVLSASEQNEADKIYKQLKEIESFKAKIDELLQEGYNPILDDGVGKNIAPLQKKGMLAYEVLNAGQLKKYLNTDW
ncbi:BREX-1 system adenine-specific DNA-methyltransferase PglX [Flavobacterium branchiophilum]|uniref:site-specific DNA-methyltransferase (adenine-specific) n=1 Tax=Flavobacterium branchiophilum (strain FL-15) TaxID=1034807 RepID=G2Z7J5_FLABF|nr:BREX-1 system adenine-specific DNA-methyltransferase PglX [Flavobacterium branchiophilum]CCB69108.1 Protein of unknown function [Flavobacterium branchiophilum FL-15]